MAFLSGHMSPAAAVNWEAYMVAKRQAVRGRVRGGGSDRTMPMILVSVGLYGLALLLGYFSVASPEAGTAMGAIRGVLYGLGGSLAIFIPLIVGWAATLVALAARGKPVSPGKIVGDGILFMLLFTVVQLFVTEDIVRNHMSLRVYSNFVSQSYRYGRGGGALGALLAWPVYACLGKWGGALLTILMALLSLTATGRTQKFIEWSGLRAEEAKVEREKRRERRINERTFDINETQDEWTYQDPHSDALETADLKKRRGRAERVASAEDSQAAAKAAQTAARREQARKPAVPRKAVPDIPASVQKAGRDRRPQPFDVAAAERRGERSLDGMDAAMTVEAVAAPPKAQPVPEKPVSAVKPVAEPKPSAKAKAPAQEMPPLSVIVETTRALDIEPLEDISPAPKPKTPASKPAKEKKRAELPENLKIDADTCDVLEPDDIAPQVKMTKLRRPVEPAIEENPYNYPSIDLLTPGENVRENYAEFDMQKAQMLEETLKQFGIQTHLTGIAHGPAVTRFELQPAPGVKVSRITSLSDDIAMHLAAMSVRIEAPIPGKAAVGVEIPNDKVEMVRLRDVLESQEAMRNSSKIAVGLGKDNSGRYIVADIAKMPHVLIAGQTGSGKSVCINSIIASILFRATPDEVKLILIDPKVVELSIYNDIPHLVCPVVTDCKKAASALDWAVAEMTTRYKRFAERGVRDIKGFNKALREGEQRMPQMVIIIDELADLMMVAPGEVEDSICRLAQLARAAGMHLVIATQRPSVNVITGIIKANIPTRIAFSVASQVDSRTMIDHGGAEKLLGNGDMLFVPNGINKPMRVQGAWISDDEVHAIVSYIKDNSETSYDQDMIEKMNTENMSDAEKEEFVSEYDPRLPEAVEIVVEVGQASVSMLQRRMRVGYARAGRLIDEMEKRGIVSVGEGSKPRNVLITREQMAQLFDDGESA